jgi:hypothetical protein
MANPKKPTLTIEPRAVAARRRRLESDIREAFAGFLSDCRRQLAAADARERLDRDLKDVAGLLAARNGPDATPAAADREAAAGQTNTEETP